MIAVSKCLLGYKCKYNGGDNKNRCVINYLKDKDYISFCPEVAGGLSTPRDPSEIISESPLRIETIHHKDITEEFLKGAKQEYNKLSQYPITEIILKENSPSCGYQTIYDGTFTHTLIKGHGLFTRQYINKNIILITEKQLEEREKHECL